MRPLFPFLVLGAAVLPACATVGKNDYVEHCSTSIATRATQEHVDDNLIAMLFETGDEDCSRNVEFMQVFNEALFNVLDREPRLFLHYFSAARHRDFILEQMENPVNDGINITRIVLQLQTITPTNQATYDALMNALRSATTNRDPEPPPD